MFIKCLIQPRHYSKHYINSFNLHKNPWRKVLLRSLGEMKTSGHRQGKSFAFGPIASAQWIWGLNPAGWLWNLNFYPLPSVTGE